MEKKTKQNLLIVIVGVGLFAALMNLRAVILFLEKGIGIILPIIVGGILALFINVPMTGIEKRLRKLLQKRKKQPSDKFYRMFSFLLTFVCVALVLTLVFTLLIPELVNSAKGLYLQIEARLPEWIAWLESLDPEAAWAENVLHVSRTFSRCFANFLSGQCTEAVILGVLMFAAFTIFRLPYGSLVGVLTAVCAIIPYVGAFLSGAVSVILALLISPALAVRCLIVYLVVQFVENQFIYPRVVGGSVGLPPLYTLVAAMIGGKLFGIMGIIFFIPIMAVVIELVKEDAGNRLSRKGNPVI